MMNKKLILSTKKSLFEPIEIEIDGRTYQSKSLSKKLVDEVLGDKIQKEAQKGNIDALYKQVYLLYDIEKDALESLDVRDVGKIVRYTVNQITSSTEEEPEKNPNGPGDKK